MVWLSGDVVLECPFCKKKIIEAFRRPERTVGSTSRISAGSKTTYHRVPESYEIRSNGCSACGKSKREIEKAFETGVTKKLTHKERLKRLKEAGLPTKIETKKRD